MQSSCRHAPSRTLTRSLLLIAATYLITGLTSAMARPEFFRFTSIADTSEHFFSHLNFPCLNNLSRIAFTGRLSSGVEGVFSRVNLGGFNTLADSGTSAFVDFGLDCSINHNAMIEVIALKKVSDGFDRVVLRGTGISSSPLIDNTGTFDEFGGFQLNITGKTALGAHRASDGVDVILVKGSGQLTGPERIVAPGTGAISQFSSFANNPAINSAGKVAFAAFKNQNHTIHILTVDEAGLVTVFLDDQGPFVGVGDVVINGSSSIAFHGTLGGGERGVWLIDQVNGQSFIKQLASSNNTPCVDFDAVALGDLDDVAFACRDFNSFSYVYLSDKFGLHRVLGPGSQLLGRRVSRANIGREAINSDKHIAILADFDDGSSAIVRANPTFLPPDFVINVTSAFQLEVSSDGGSPSISKPVNIRPGLLTLSFDVSFPARASSNLNVMLGDKLLKSVSASPPGVRQHISIPIDLRKASRTSSVEQLRFEITGKSSAAVQISNVVMPGVLTDAMNSGDNGHWHIDTSKGGHAALVDTTAFPVRVEISSDSKQKAQVPTNRAVPVAILSSEGFDATHDIDRSTLTFNGVLLETGVSNAADKSLPCTERDVNADKLPDLVCNVVLKNTAKISSSKTVHVSAISTHGWNIAGSSDNIGRSDIMSDTTP
ncbi:MAG TPA: hypothetical protein VHL14_04310 [Steroidobacteraceae bacterium]|nr:hypothetical protein [Steroidobacteraceae bacterium]